jgi:hypothetical protein
MHGECRATRTQALKTLSAGSARRHPVRAVIEAAITDRHPVLWGALPSASMPSLKAVAVRSKDGWLGAPKRGPVTGDRCPPLMPEKIMENENIRGKC